MASNGKETLRPRAGGGHGLVSDQPAQVYSRPARPFGHEDARPLCLLWHIGKSPAGSTILAGEPVGFPHPIQVEDVVQRGQCHPAFRSCQFNYPLPFRGQVCETQGSLPCFPSAVLSTRRLPSLDWVPVSPVPQRHEHYEGATTPTLRITGRLFVSLPAPTRFLLGSCSLLPALPSGWRSRIGPGSLFARGSPLPARSHVDVSGTSQVSR